MTVVTVPLVVAVAYCAGVRRYAGPGPSWRRGVRRLGPCRVVAFLSGLAVTAVVLSPPARDVAEGRLWLHMSQHMVLLVVSAPLLAAGSPGVPLLLLLPVRARGRVAGWRWRLRKAPVTSALWLPITAWVLSVAALWLWHLPGSFEAADSTKILHETEHLTLLATAWAFWWHVLRAGQRRLTGVGGVLYVFAATLPMAALGAVLTFATQPLYPQQAAEAVESGYDPLVDQQLAGLVMWVPPEILYLLVSVVLFVGWLRRLEDSTAIASPRQLPSPGSAAAQPVAVTPPVLERVGNAKETRR